VRQKRTKIWIDKFQTTLSIRLALYFLVYQAAIWSLFWIDGRLVDFTKSIGGPAATFGFVLTPLAVVGLGLLFIYDAIKEAHRIVGPLYRIRKTMQSVTAGDEIRLIVLRKGDHLQELKDDVNAMLRALEERGAITIRGAVEPATAIA
jgi:nitrogen fixation/metabolism regulation signal transduction histidine kinase